MPLNVSIGEIIPPTPEDLFGIHSWLSIMQSTFGQDPFPVQHLTQATSGLDFRAYCRCFTGSTLHPVPQHTHADAWK